MDQPVVPPPLPEEVAKKKSGSKAFWIVGAILGGLAVLAVGLFFVIRSFWQNPEFQKAFREGFDRTMAANQSAPDLENTQLLETDWFSMRYPGNWKAEATEEQGLPAWVLTASDGSNVRFIVAENAVDEESVVMETEKAMNQGGVFLQTEGEGKEFDHWADMEGFGRIFQVKAMKLISMEMRVFCHSGSRSAMIMVAAIPSMGKKEVENAGLDYIEEQFKWLKD